MSRDRILELVLLVENLTNSGWLVFRPIGIRAEGTSLYRASDFDEALHCI